MCLSVCLADAPQAESVAMVETMEEGSLECSEVTELQLDHTTASQSVEL